jgi:hypothetical protein
MKNYLLHHLEIAKNRVKIEKKKHKKTQIAIK